MGPKSVVTRGLPFFVIGALALLIHAGVTEAKPATAPGAWRDPSPHKTQFIKVDRNLRLEVLDWGGSGPAIILLAASGDTAHEFDDFAPKLTARHHVYGITRRGYGASGFDPAKYGSDRLGDDVIGVMDALRLDRPILVGHSFGGVELSDIATRYPNRISGVIYLEAAYTFAFRNGEAPTMQEFQEILKAPETPPPSPADLTGFTALQRYLERMTGVRMPEAELRQRWTQSPDGRVGGRRAFPGSATLTKGARQFSYHTAPALVIFANPHSLGPWLDDNPDLAVRAGVRAYSVAYQSFVQRQAKAVTDGMPNSHVIALPRANHFVFISNEAEVLHDIDAFVAGLPHLPG